MIRLALLLSLFALAPSLFAAKPNILFIRTEDCDADYAAESA